MSLRLKTRVDLDGVVHKHDKLGAPLTELTLAFPISMDLRLLRRAAPRAGRKAARSTSPPGCTSRTRTARAAPST